MSSLAVRLATSTLATLSAQCVLSAPLVLAPSPICGALMTTPLDNWTSGLYPLLPIAPGAAEAGGNPVPLGTRIRVGEKSTSPDTMRAVGSADDECCTAVVPPALASFGV